VKTKRKGITVSAAYAQQLRRERNELLAAARAALALWDGCTVDELQKVRAQLRAAVAKAERSNP
jgi:hypothetical protein